MLKRFLAAKKLKYSQNRSPKWRFFGNIGSRWCSGRALDLRLEIAGSIPAAALSSATLDKSFTQIVQRL